MNFFDKQAKVLPTKEITLPSFGKIVLEKLDYAKTMKYWELSSQMLTKYKSEPFPPLYNENGDIVTIDITQAWCDTCSMLVVVQKMQDWGFTEEGMPIDNRYPFEQFVAASVVCEDEYNLLVNEMNELNALITEVTTDPKASELEVSSGKKQKSASA